MICTSAFSLFGSAVGLGFGIYAATQNFNPDAHQSASMMESTRIFSELLTQIGLVGLQAGSMGFMAAVVGGLLDCALQCCGKDLSKESTELLVDYFKNTDKREPDKHKSGDRDCYGTFDEDYPAPSVY